MIRMGAVPAAGLTALTWEERRRAVTSLADAGLDGVLAADHVSFRTGAGTEALVMMAGEVKRLLVAHAGG